ncbi:hypothetical protein PR202_gb13301 [Eleusine coracana subsp. coracana]|uniref:Chalcone synthase n=1 Tax=Eleusine coracana subsp. coracana TaxID=191504 RepID=A0AAV5ERQ3_ELECO|nr:hypothetical protein QOZ80_9BG0713000 [Eleusine coracana subsp. coracana]GJN25472.1 hypothetical protein PR202_gb13301 [Eleusine coracana subsp. coracana]
MAGNGCPAVSVLQESGQAQHTDGTAAVLAIGTANPANCMRQDEFVDWFFRVTKIDHLATLKAKMKRICEKSGVEKRYFCLTEEMIGSHPGFINRTLPSLSARMTIVTAAVPDLAAAAARKAIDEWGRPATDITHLVVSTSSGNHAPGADLHVAQALGLRPTVHRTLLYLHGCFGGCSAIRVAKDLAENNNPGARVLVVCSEVYTPLAFGAPDEEKMDAIVATSLFGDGAGAVIVGAGLTQHPTERPIFRMVSASQTTIPETERALTMQLGESGIHYGMSAEVPKHVRGSIEGCLAETLRPLGLGEWNSLFWVVHPGGRAVLDSCEAALQLEPGKLAASQRVLSEHGNVGAATIIFVLDEMRRRRKNVGEEEGGVDDGEWGVMLGIGPGITIEKMVLRAG